MTDSDKQASAEHVEGRRVVSQNTEEFPALQTQSCIEAHHASMGLDGVRKIAKAQKHLRFTSLLHHITPQLLVESFYQLETKAAAGIDGITWHDYESKLYGRVHSLHQEIQAGRYRAQASRRVFIDKADGKKRALGIAAMEDKLVQQAFVTVLNAIYEQDFLGFSYGYRVGRSQHDALDALAVGITDQEIHWIIDADIKAFFDEIDHEHLLNFLTYRIADQRILRMIKKWLKAGTIEDGVRIPAHKGTPQGAVISPLLANIYLHYVLDTWAKQWRAEKAAVGAVIFVRYADDTVMGFQFEGQAKQFLNELRARLKAYKLELHPDKTRLIRFGKHARAQCEKRKEGKPKSFDFLGFTHCCGRTRNGKHYKLVRLTIKKKMRATLADIRAKLMRLRHEPIPQIGKWLRQVMQGYYNYYAIPGNLVRLNGFRSEINRTWRHALMRRSQRNRLNWARFNRLVRKYIPQCKQVHPYPSQRFYAKYD